MPEFPPSQEAARYELACQQLRAGNFGDGFRNYQSRWAAAGLPRPVDTDRDLLGPEWRGQDLRGKSILLHAEQGFGDTIQFIRYVPRVAQLNPEHLVLEVQPALRSLAAHMPGLHCTLGTGKPTLPRFDFHCSLMDLPLVFETTLDTIPPPPPIEISEQRFAHWQNRLERNSPGLRNIALVWTGNPANSINERRSIPLAELAPLWENHGDAFYSLQLGAEPPHPVQNLAPELTCFTETAAALTHMDLVVTIDTAVAHLAGTLGRPTALLTCHKPCWRWLEDITGSPWYPSLHLIRQRTPGDWYTVVQELIRKYFT